ncbi:hypothetical protein TNCV_2406101 [Trichonephila clavipes]|nr:hypothetical protein TNCV_2406101 [Trichonephila clavipes]
MVLGAIEYNTRSLLILIQGTITAQRYVRKILQSHVGPIIASLPETIFRQNNARPQRVLQGNLHHISLACLIPGYVTDRENLQSFKTTN